VGDDGGGPWEEVVSRKRQASRSPPPPPPLVPANLNGLCFNCFSDSHFAARCPHPAQCFRCHRLGHREEDCTLPMVLRWRMPGYVPVPPRPPGGWFAAATSAASGRPAAAPASASLGPAAAGFPPPPPPPRRDPSPPPPPPHRASPPPPPSPRRASPLSTHPTRWASPPPLQPRDPAARPPPRRDGVRRGATGSHPRLGRGRLAACAPQDPPPRLGREGWPVAAVCGTQPPAAASGAEAGRGPIGHLSFDAASPLPVDHPFRRPRSETCIIPRTVEIAANEIALERALVVMVAGTRPVNAFRCPGLHHGSLRLAVWVIYNACAPSGGLPYAFSGL
jgi:hypothetical protein